jgi:hypothetical protein
VTLLTVENVTRRLGGIVALDEVSTTPFNGITRVYTADEDRVDSRVARRR